MKIVVFLAFLASCTPFAQIEDDVIQGEMQVIEKVAEDIATPSKPVVTVVKKSF